MTLCTDLSRLIKGELENGGFRFDASMPLHRLVARYFELNVRRIHPVPRRVHFSDQVHAFLGRLLRSDRRGPSARDTRGTVFRLRRLLVEGANVNAFLSKNICDAAGWDGLLWHYGMHHFHLGSEMEVGGFVKRSHHLLFAIIAPRDAYFVDVRPHPSRRSIDWVRQDLLGIVYSNWPRLIDAHMLRGIRGAGLADEDIHRLRRTNLNAAIDIDGKAVTPLLGGVAGDGSSVLCTIHAGRLLQDLRRHDEILAGNDVREAVARNLQAQGLDAGPMLEFELVFLESLSSTPDLLAALTAEACVSRNLSRMGLAVIEKRTGSPIVLHEAEQSRA